MPKSSLNGMTSAAGPTTIMTTATTEKKEKRIYVRKIIRSYATDIICLMIFGIAAWAIEFIPPREVSFDTSDRTINLPKVDRTWVPNYILPLFSTGLPLLVISSFMARKRFKQKRLLVAVLGLLLSVFLSFLFTNILKNSIGRLRPDFFKYFGIPDDKLSSPDEVAKIIKSANVPDERRSFPSGHSSSSFGGLCFAALLMAGQFKLLNGEARLDRLLLCLLPLVLAGLVSLSRIIDHRHHWEDVLVGSIIGIVCATFSYFFYFPSLWSEKCNEPLDARFVRLKIEAAHEARTATPTEPTNVIEKENVV